LINKYNLTFDYKSYHFDLEMRGSVVIIDGDTSSGKTFICECLRKYKEYLEDNGDSTFDNIMLFGKSKMDLEVITSLPKPGKIVIIDNADRILAGNSKLIEHIANDRCNNAYIIIGRVHYDIDLSPNYYATVQEKNKYFTLCYSNEVPGWY